MTIGATIGAILPLAVGIAIFPIPILTVILLLLSRRPRANGMSFAASWILGIGLLMSIFTLLADGAGAASDRDVSAIVNRATEQMEALKDWLVQNCSTIMAVILVILGTMLAGNGISALSS